MGRENVAKTPFDLPQDPTLEDLLRVLARTIKLQIRTHCPATVVLYNPTIQKATVTVDNLQVVRVTDPARIPARLQSLKGTPPNAEATLQPLQLVDVPVAWPRTNSGYVTFPLNPGDTGELHIQDRSLEAWLQLGIATDPVFAFTHALKDAVFHPGLHPDTNPISGGTDQTATVINGATAIKIGALATSAIAKADKLVTAIDNAWAAATPVANDGGAALKSTFLTSWNASKGTIAALKGKVE